MSRTAVRRARLAGRNAMSHRFGHTHCMEALDKRLLFANIDWVNRGPGDGFEQFGIYQNAARSIVDRVISDWERVIVNFNYGDGSNTFDLTVVGFPGFPGQVVDIDPDADGKPRSATMRLNPTDQRYFDTTLGTPTVPDDAEFDDLISPFKAFGPVNLLDLYTVASHELGHALGIAYQSNLAIADFVELDEWAVDPLNPGDGCPPNDPTCTDHGNHVYPVYVGGQVRYTMTDAGTDPPHAVPSHLYEGPPVNNWPTQPHDLLADGRDGDSARRLISDKTAGFLRDVYGYTINLPSQTNTFYANFNTTNGALVIEGDPDDADDIITLDIVGTNVRVQVNGTSELIPVADVESITIFGRGGDDTINILEVPSGVEVGVSAWTGNDTINIANGDLDNEIRGPVTVTSGSGSDSLRLFDQNDTGTDTYSITNITVTKPGTLFGGLTYSSDTDILVVTANDAQNLINIENVFGSVDLTVNGRSGDDTFVVGGTNRVIGGAIAGNLAINGGVLGNDRVIFDDSAGTGQDIYLLNGGNYQQTGTNILTFSDIEAAELHANDENSGIAVANTFGYPLEIQGNGGDDFIDLGFGVLAATSNTTVFGGDGTDTLRLNDTSTFAPTTFLVNQTGGLPFVDLFNGNQLVTYDSISNLTLDGGPFADTMTSIALPTTTSLRMNGNGGDDFIDVQGHPTLNSALFPRVTVTGGAGNDTVEVNTDGAGGARAEFVQNEVLDRLALGAGGRLRLAPGKHIIDVLNSVSMPASGFELDLTDGFFVRRGNPSFPFYNDRIAVGYNGGAWNGLGITSSTAAGSAIGDGVGIARAAELFGGGGGVVAGINLGANDIFMRYTLYGDATMDGTVNLLDFNRVAANFGSTGTTWARGNFNFDNSTNLLDFNALAANFGQSVA